VGATNLEVLRGGRAIARGSMGDAICMHILRERTSSNAFFFFGGAHIFQLTTFWTSGLGIWALPFFLSFQITFFFFFLVFIAKWFRSRLVVGGCGSWFLVLNSWLWWY